MTSPAPEIFWRKSSDFCINYIDFLRYSSVNPNDILRQDREKIPLHKKDIMKSTSFVLAGCMLLSSVISQAVAAAETLPGSTEGRDNEIYAVTGSNRFIQQRDLFASQRWRGDQATQDVAVGPAQ
jgi:hypothetical protein